MQRLQSLAFSVSCFFMIVSLILALSAAVASDSEGHWLNGITAACLFCLSCVGFALELKGWT